MNDINKTHMEKLSMHDPDCVRKLITAAGYMVSHEYTEEKKEASYTPIGELNLSSASQRFLESKGITSLWRHQALAVQAATRNENLCVTTSTSSGKTEIFQLAALEALARNPEGRVLAVYPMKALNRQQVECWKKAIPDIGKIDGDVKDFTERKHILEECKVVVMPPDVIHSYLLANLNHPLYGNAVHRFIKGLCLVIIDELHLFKGVFGTNSAYVFRRLNNLHRLLNKDGQAPQYITASATLPNAREHSSNISGTGDFVEIGMTEDGSPSAAKTFLFVEPVQGNGSSKNDRLLDLMDGIYRMEDCKSITFVEGRQRAGELANAIDRISTEKQGVYPYRAGYEAESMEIITSHMHEGNFKGIISTSALEIGIDIDGLNLVIIADMPHDKNSYRQRIGRVGRTNSGDRSYVIIVRNRSFSSALLFDAYNFDIDKVLPTYEPALYLSDDKVLNMHACCHVGDIDNCELAEWKNRNGQFTEFRYKDSFPPRFAKRCQEVLDGNAPQSYIVEMGSCFAPHSERPLRFFGEQFTIIPPEGALRTVPEEQITRAQLATEGYPMAIRNTLKNGKKIRERMGYFKPVAGIVYAEEWSDKLKTTQPNKRTYLRPNFNPGVRNVTLLYGDTKVYNLHVEEFCNLYGYYEILYTKKEYKPYPKTQRLPIFRTTGTLFFHPSFNNPKVSVRQIALVLFETFLKRNAFDRNDISHIGGTVFVSEENVKKADRFVALYDASAFNITKRLATGTALKDLFTFIRDYLAVLLGSICPTMNDPTRQAIQGLCDDILNQPEVSDTKPSDKTEALFKVGTWVLYRTSDPAETDVEPKQVPVKIVGRSSDGVTYNLFDGQDIYMDILPGELTPMDETEYE